MILPSFPPKSFLPRQCFGFYTLSYLYVVHVADLRRLTGRFMADHDYIRIMVRGILVVWVL